MCSGNCWQLIYGMAPFLRLYNAKYVICIDFSKIVFENWLFYKEFILQKWRHGKFRTVAYPKICFGMAPNY